MSKLCNNNANSNGALVWISALDRITVGETDEITTLAEIRLLLLTEN